MPHLFRSVLTAVNRSVSHDWPFVRFKRADEYTSGEKILIDAVGAKQEVDRVNQL
jgi:hypothetical protein